MPQLLENALSASRRHFHIHFVLYRQSLAGDSKIGLWGQAELGDVEEIRGPHIQFQLEMSMLFLEFAPKSARCWLNAKPWSERRPLLERMER
jgi:hypothetical protein